MLLTVFDGSEIGELPRPKLNFRNAINGVEESHSQASLKGKMIDAVSLTTVKKKTYLISLVCIKTEVQASLYLKTKKKLASL